MLKSDPPPRVAFFPLGVRDAVVNFAELPVACRIVGLGGMVSRLRVAFDGATLRLPPHALIVVEQ
jgi:hypothetical protein